MKVKLLEPITFFKGDKEMPVGSIVAVDYFSAEKLLASGHVTTDLKAVVPPKSVKPKPTKSE